MRILVETSGGGGIVLVVVAALLAGHSGDVSAAVAAVVITLAVVVTLALAGVAGYLIYRARRGRETPSRQGIVAAPVMHYLSGPERPAIEQPRTVRLEPGQLAELAEMLRRQAEQ